MASFKFKNVYLNDYYTVVGPLEKNSHLRRLDLVMDDYYIGEKTFEQAEVKMQQLVIDNLIGKNNLAISDIDLLVGGDLTNQIAISNYSAKNYNIPFLGLYSACATFAESLIVGASMIDSGKLKKVVSITSSHNLTAERQFRYPVEYGAPKPHTATFTTTGAVSTLLSKNYSKIKLESATIGVPVDLGVTDVNNMGAAMAPASASTIATHLAALKRDANYYDLILTGDLGRYGKDILKDYMAVNYDMELNNYDDCGAMLYDYENQEEVLAGGSGPVCSALVNFGYIFNQMRTGKLKRVLLIATGALFSPTLLYQKQNINSIAHAISLEVL